MFEKLFRRSEKRALRSQVKELTALLQTAMDHISNQENQVKELTTELQKAKDHISSPEIQAAELSTQLHLAQNQIGRQEKEVWDLRVQLSSAQDLISSQEKKISQLSAGLHAEEKDYNIVFDQVEYLTRELDKAHHLTSHVKDLKRMEQDRCAEALRKNRQLEDQLRFLKEQMEILKNQEEQLRNNYLQQKLDLDWCPDEQSPQDQEEVSRPRAEPDLKDHQHLQLQLQVMSGSTFRETEDLEGVHRQSSMDKEGDRQPCCAGTPQLRGPPEDQVHQQEDQDRSLPPTSRETDFFLTEDKEESGTASEEQTQGLALSPHREKGC